MKFLWYVLIPVVLCASLEGARRSKKAKGSSKTSFAWPSQTFTQTQNDITLTVHPLSKEETSNLFLDAGKNLLTCKSWFVASPILPLKITLKNNSAIPITLSSQHINLGKTWFGFKKEPISMAYVIDVLHGSWFWSSPLIVHNTDIRDSRGNHSTGTSYEVDDNPLFTTTFFNLDTFTLEALYAADMAILKSTDRLSTTIVIEKGTTKDILLFVWAHDIKPNLTISIAKNIFYVDLCTQPQELLTEFIKQEESALITVK